MLFTYSRPLSTSVLVLWLPSVLCLDVTYAGFSLPQQVLIKHVTPVPSVNGQNGCVKQPLPSSAPHRMEAAQVSQGKPTVDPQMQQEDVKQSDRKVGDIVTQDSCRLCCQGWSVLGVGAVLKALLP